MGKGVGKFEYEAQEPAFLKRMRGEVAGNGLDGRHERPIARPRLAKTNDEDDGPTYVDEENNDTLTKAEYEALVKQSEEGDKTKDTASEAQANSAISEDAPKSAQAVAQVGQSQKKRKAVKIGGGDDVDSGDDTPTTSTKQKPKRVAKKVKKAVTLSFGDDADGA